jgi:cell division protease FtsH
MMDEMCAALGGRAAEQIIFGKVSTGALSDLEKVTRQATAMVTVYGLSDKIGNISYYDSSGQNSGFNKPYSEQTARKIDEEVKELTEVAYKKALKVLEENKNSLTKLAYELLNKEVIFKEDLETIFGKRQWDKDEKVTLNPSKSDKKVKVKEQAIKNEEKPV